MIRQQPQQPVEDFGTFSNASLCGRGPAYEPDKLIVGFKDGFDPGAVLADLAARGIAVTPLFPDEPAGSDLANIFIVQMDPAQLDSLKAELARHPGVEYVERSGIKHTC